MSMAEDDPDFLRLVEDLTPELDASIVSSEIMKWDEVVKQHEYDILFNGIVGSVRSELAARTQPYFLEDATRKYYAGMIARTLLEDTETRPSLMQFATDLSKECGLSPEESDQVLNEAIMVDLRTQNELEGILEATEMSELGYDL